MIEDSKVAEKISELMIEIGKKLDDSILLVKNNCSEDEFYLYRKATSKIMGEVLLEVMNPIYAIHPNIKPDELK